MSLSPPTRFSRQIRTVGALRVLLAPAMFGPALLGLTPWSAHAQTAARPAISLVRSSEDWSVLAYPDVPREPLDGLKYIPLSAGDPHTYLSLGANLRERFETNDPQFGIGRSRQTDYVLSRVQVHADLRIAGQVQVFVQLASEEALGKRHPSPVDDDRLSLEQAFVAVTEPLGDGQLLIRAGRQEIAFDLQRFLSQRDGPIIRQAYDGATVAYTTGRWRFIALYTDPVQEKDLRAFDDSSGPHLTFGLLRVERKLTATSTLSAYVGRFTQDAVRFPSASGDERRDLVDVRLTGTAGAYDWDAEGMTQTGRIGAQSIHAWAVGAVGGYTFKAIPIKPRFSLQFDAASGDKNPHDDELNTFNPLFPSGYYFNTAGYQTYANLEHVKAALTVTPKDRLTVETGVGGEWRETIADAIFVIPDVPVAGTAGRGGRYVGAYGELRADYAVNRHASLTLEAVHFVSGETLVAAGGRSPNYLGLSFRFGW